MPRTNEAATVATVAAGSSAPSGANTLQSHFTHVEPRCQDPAVTRLHRLATLAKACGDDAGYCWNRRAMLLLQAELWQRGGGK